MEVPVTNTIPLEDSGSDGQEDDTSPGYLRRRQCWWNPNKSIPSTFQSKIEYESIFKDIILAEMECNEAYAKTSRMKKLSIRWEKQAGSKFYGYFVPQKFDSNYFRMSVGDELVVRLENNDSWIRNCYVDSISNTADGEVKIRLKDGSEVELEITKPYSIEPKFPKFLFLRQISALKKLVQVKDEKFEFLLDSIMNKKKPNKKYVKPNVTFDANKIETLSNKTLNVSQLEAIRMAMTEDISIIHGPPGTGKTETIVTIIYNLIKQSPQIKILVCAPCNTGVDLLAQKLDEAKINLIRYFSVRATRLDSPLKRLSLTEQIFHNNEKLRQNYENYFEKNMTPKAYEQYEKEFSKTKDDLIKDVSVVCCTCLTAGSNDLKNVKYDVVLIDDAAQATEPECMVPIIWHGAKKLILSGDPEQLGAIVLSSDAIAAGLEISLMERLMKQKNVKTTLLNLQYRMAPVIAKFPCKTFYHGKIQNGVQTVDRLMPFNWLKFLGYRDSPIVFINVDDIEEPIGHSFYNTEEANVVVKLLKLILAHNVEPEQIGVITPYDGQRCLLRQLMSLDKGQISKKKLFKTEVANVDFFQGKEKDIIIVSFVRSNLEEPGSNGFVSDLRRMNVALTRAKCKLFVIANMDIINNTSNHYSTYVNFINFIRNEGTVVPAKLFEQQFELGGHLCVLSFFQSGSGKQINRSVKKPKRRFKKN